MHPKQLKDGNLQQNWADHLRHHVEKVHGMAGRQTKSSLRSWNDDCNIIY